MFSFRFKDGLEFGLGGITSWSSDKHDFVFNDEHGTHLVAPRDNLMCFRILNEQPVNVEGTVKQVAKESEIAPETVKAVHKQGVAEGGRFVLMPTADKGMLLVDSETDATFAGDEKMAHIVELANEADLARKRKEQTEEYARDAEVVISIKDMDADPHITLSRKAFNDKIAAQEIRLVQAPCVDWGADRFRISMAGSGVELRRCILNVDTKTPTEEIRQEVPVDPQDSTA